MGLKQRSLSLGATAAGSKSDPSESLCPSVEALMRPGKIKSIVADWRGDFEEHDRAYRSSLYRRCANRYDLAWQLWSDPELQKAWTTQVGPFFAVRESDEDGENILRSVLVATIRDLKTASKTFRRLLAPWREAVDPKQIFKWLHDNKLQGGGGKSPKKKVSIAAFDRKPLVIPAGVPLLKPKDGQTIVLQGKVLRCNGADVEVGKISAFVR